MLPMFFDTDFSISGLEKTKWVFGNLCGKDNTPPGTPHYGNFQTEIGFHGLWIGQLLIELGPSWKA